MSAALRGLSNPVVVRAAQVATGLLLGWAALAKLGDIPGFARQIHNFRLLPLPADNALAMALPWIELVAALALLLGVRARAGAVVATSLLAVFTVAVAVAVVRGLNIECGCFGTAGAARTGGAKLAENLGMLGLAVVGLAPGVADAAAPDRAGERVAPPLPSAPPGG